MVVEPCRERQEEERDEVGEDSELHIIIFDELDAICRARGSTRDGTGVHDSVVNQLLSKIDGVDALNNILLGLTLVTSIYPVSQNKSFVWIGGVFAVMSG